jgi:ATP-dependent Lhr-like helicase
MRQAYQEVFDQQMEEVRLRNMLQRIQSSKIILTYPNQLTPFCFPVKVDSLRENLSSEKLEDRVRKMQEVLEGDAKTQRGQRSRESKDAGKAEMQGRQRPD